MTVAEIARILEAEVLAGKNLLDREIVLVCGGDLMSDVLTFRCTGAMLLTGLAHLQVVRTAEIAGIAAICLVRGKRPAPETLQLAADKEIVLLTTKLSLYTACGRLYKENLAPCQQS